MMYPYMTLWDGTEILHSELIEDGEMKRVIVHFERPTEDGRKSARCLLPEYRWMMNEGFSSEEIAFFDQLLHTNAHLLYRYAACGGIRID